MDNPCIKQWMKRSTGRFFRRGLSRRAGISIVLGGLAVASAMPAASADKAAIAEPSVGELFRAFETVVFGSEYGDQGARNKVWKWGQPLRVSVQAYAERVIDHGNDVTEIAFENIPVSQQQFGLVAKHLQALMEITGLQTEGNKLMAQVPNVTVNFVPQFQMGNPVLAPIDPKILKRRAAEQGCYFVLWNKPETTSIDHAVIVVNSERPLDHLDHCILEELTQVLGFPNDNNVAWASIFSNRHRVTELSRHDRILIGALYDPEITPGMGRKEALRRARRIIAGMGRKNTGDK